jgi:hypothetical protein
MHGACQGTDCCKSDTFAKPLRLVAVFCPFHGRLDVSAQVKTSHRQLSLWNAPLRVSSIKIPLTCRPLDGYLNRDRPLNDCDAAS